MPKEAVGMKEIKEKSNALIVRAKREPREFTRDRGDRGFERIVGIGVIGLLSTFVAVALDQPMYFLASIPAVVALFYATRRIVQ